MMPQPMKTYKQLARMMYGGTSDPLAKTRMKDENDNILALITRSIFHKTRDKKFKFAFNKLHEVLNILEERSEECELLSSIRN